MSDVVGAAAPAPAASAATEVPVGEAPVNLPNAVGPQAPDKAVGPDHKGSPHRPESRREAIQRAFQRSAEAKPAEAKMGHNQPPEPMEKEKEKEKEKPKIDLRKPPKKEAADDDAKPARERGDHGHFAPRQASQPNQPSQPSQLSQARQHKQLPPNAPYREPPSRWRDGAKAEWHATPENVRGEIYRMHQEFGQAYKQYRADHELMNTIRPFAELAQKQGTHIAPVLSNYIAMEHKLRNDLVAGLDTIVNNLNLRTPDGTKIGLRDVAWHIVNQTPEQAQLIEAQNRQAAHQHQLMQAQQRIAQLENHARQVQYQARYHQTQVGVDNFARTHPRLDELGDLIVQEINLGFPLEVAYRRAEAFRPSTRAAQTRTPPAQTRTVDRSISGAPGPNGVARPREKVGRREAIERAITRANRF